MSTLKDSPGLKNTPAKIAVIGGTHGNELTGVYLVNHWKKQSLAKKYSELSIKFLLANPDAIEQQKRYIDQDLNRSFKLQDLSDQTKQNREQKLAREINQTLGPKGAARTDFIIDLHTSTANMRTNIVLIKMDAFHLGLAAFLKQNIADVVITSESQLMADHHFLCSIADKGVVVEVGPIPQGALDANCFEKTRTALDACLEYMQLYHQQKLPDLQPELQVMSYFSRLYFPTDADGEINAMVHPGLIGMDYSKIIDGTPVFRSFSGEDIFYRGKDAHVAFVNEAAYYDQKIAMCLCNPVTYSLATLQPIDLQVG